MSDENKNEEVIEEKPEAQTEEKAGTPKEEKKEKAKKEKAEKKKEEKTEPQEDKKPEAPQAQSDAYLRLLAEYDNYRKRSQREKDSLYAKFLPVYDNLVRALKQPTEDEAYRKGIEMIMTQFNTTMEKLGVEKIESLGRTFDPALHNAVMHVDDETKGENEIVEVFQEGFRLGDKVIRFAMVKVAN